MLNQGRPITTDEKRRIEIQSLKTFGVGRDAFVKKVINRDKLYPDPIVPGPGTYDSVNAIGKDAQKVTLKTRNDYYDADVVALR